MTRTNDATWDLASTQIERGSRAYWRRVASDGLPAEDWDRATCEGDSGYGPCGRHIEWGRGKCANGHEIEFRDED